MNETAVEGTTQAAIELAEQWGAHNYHPLPVVIAEGKGVWVQDVEGKSYMDMLAAYSALNFGHRYPRLVDAAKRQLDHLTLTSRAFHNDQLGPFCKALAELCGMESVLVMNSGVEAVETAVKLSRRWAYDVKGVAPDKAKVIVCAGNFHGRTTTVVSFSTDPDSRGGFGPFTPGFEVIPYGDAGALAAAIDDNTAAFLVEPIQGEGGVIIPPDGFLAEARRICSERNVLLVVDEIQSGLGRTGKTFACEHENVVPDVYILGKALAGGIVPLSAVVAHWDVMKVIGPGQHGSTFGGNPLACAIGREVLAILASGEMQERSAVMGKRFADGLRSTDLSSVVAIRNRGLWFGIDLHREASTARQGCEALLEKGLLCKDAHKQTIRLSPPLIIEEDEVDWALERLVQVLA